MRRRYVSVFRIRKAVSLKETHADLVRMDVSKKNGRHAQDRMAEGSDGVPVLMNRRYVPSIDRWRLVGVKDGRPVRFELGCWIDRYPDRYRLVGDVLDNKRFRATDRHVRNRFGMRTQGPPRGSADSDVFDAQPSQNPRMEIVYDRVEEEDGIKPNDLVVVLIELRFFLRDPSVGYTIAVIRLHRVDTSFPLSNHDHHHDGFHDRDDDDNDEAHHRGGPFTHGSGSGREGGGHTLSRRDQEPHDRVDARRAGHHVQ